MYGAEAPVHDESQLHAREGGDVAMGLSRKEKHPPDSHVPQPQETTALEQVVGEPRVRAPGELLGLGDCTGPGSWET